MKEFDRESSATEELYNGDKFNQTLEKLGLEDYTLGLSGSLSEREFVMAHVGRHKSPLYSKDKICCVYEVYNGEPIDIGTGKLLKEIESEIPFKLKNKNVVPSLKGQYLKVMICDARTDESGKEYVRPHTPSYWIPIEWVRQKVKYNEGNTQLDV